MDHLDPDPEDIYRQIDLENEAECTAEVTRLRKKLRGYKTHFTIAFNILSSLVNASQNGDNQFDRSTDTMNAMRRAREKLESRFNKLEKCFRRLMELTSENDPLVVYEDALEAYCERYTQAIQGMGNLMIAMNPPPAPHQAPIAGHAQILRPIEALKPSFPLSFDNSPTELAAWMSQFRAYHEASKLQGVTVEQQQAFLRQGLHPDVWTAIQQNLTSETYIFKDPLYPDDDSCEKFIENAFQIRYPLIMRRYRFFTYVRKGNQTFTNFFAKLRELAAAAQLENLNQNDYLIFRVITGLNDPDSVDKLLSIPQADFNLEEVHRVAVACEAAKNYTGLSTKSGNISLKVSQKKTNQTSHKQVTGTNAKLNALKEQGRCIRCGKKAHQSGDICPHRNTQCHNCGVKGHISPVCSKPKSGNNSHNGPKHAKKANPYWKNHANQTNVSNFTFAGTTYHGPRPTPRQLISFQSSLTEFEHNVIPDSGSSRTIFAKSLLDKHSIPFEPNYENEELFNASSNPMTVNGTVKLTASFQGKSTLIDALVSEDLKDNVLLSWYDAEELGSISIARYASLGDPSERIAKVKKKFSKVLRDSLSDKPMDGPPMKIHFKKQALANGIHPKKVYTAAQPPLHLKKSADKVLKEAIKNKLIEEVPVNEPSEWCSRGFFVPKPSGEARLVVDLSPLNELIERPIHPFIAGTDLLKNLDPNSRVFCKLDAVLGYYQIPLDEESKKLMTFLLASGRYRYLRAPMGCSASSDEWCKRSDAALAGIEGVHKLVDDILIEGKDYDHLFARIETVLQRCVNSNITISLKKMQVGETVVFAGFQVSAKGIHPVKERMQAITDYPTPTNTTELKGFLGLSTQLGHFVPDVAHATNPLTALLKKNTAWNWLPEQTEAFQRTKKILTGNLVLRPFNPSYATELFTDASRKGLGFVLLQQDPATGNRHLIQCGSRSLSSPESRYAVCELEGLAILYGIEKCRHFLLGMENFTVVTDHKPLKGVFAKELPDVQNVRLRRYRERLTGYTFKIEWREGKTNEMADALSRAPVFPANESNSADFVDICYAISTLKQEPSDPILAPMLDAAKVDTDYQLIIQALSKIKDPKSLPNAHPGRQLSSVWSQLSVDQTGLIVVDGRKIYVPSGHRKTLLTALHAAHCGTHKTTWRAKDLYYWRGMSSDVKLLVQDCDICRPFLPSQAQEPIIPGTSATGPMTDVGSDLFQIGHNYYIVMMDRYSGFPFVEKLSKLSTSAITKVLTDWFNTFGWPERIRTDNGPQYRSEFDEFCKKTRHFAREFQPLL